MVADKFKNGVDPKISDPQLSGCSWTLKHFRIFPSSTILIFIKYISTLPIFAVVHNFPIHTLYAHMSCIWGGDMFIYIHNLGYLTFNVDKIHECFSDLEKIYDSVNGSLKGSLNMIQKQPKSIKIQRVDPLISQKLTLFWTVFPRVLFKKVEFLLKSAFTLGKQVEVVFLRKNESGLNWSDFLLNTLGETTCITHFLDYFFHETTLLPWENSTKAD